MNERDMLTCVSFLLGKTHGAIFNILMQETKDSYKIRAFATLECELRQEIERLYYPVNPHNQDTHS